MFIKSGRRLQVIINEGYERFLEYGTGIIVKGKK